VVRAVRPVTRVARGATYLFIQGIMSNVLGLVYFYMMLRVLPSPEQGPEMGFFAILSIILAAVSVFSTFAIGLAATKYIPQYIGEGHVEKARSVVTRLLQFSLLSSIAFTVVFLLSAKWLAVTIAGDPMWAPLFYIFAFSAFFVILNSIIPLFLQGLQRFREYAMVSFLGDLTHRLVAISLLSLGMGLYGIVWSWLAGFMVSSLGSLILTAKFIGVFEKPHPLKPLIKFSYPLHISNILVFFATYVDQILILPLLGVAALGYYNVAVRATAVPGLISGSIATALFPQLSELHTRKGKAVLTQAFHISTRVVLVSFPAIFGLAALAYPLVMLVRAEYVNAIAPLVVLCLSSLIGTLGIAIWPTLMTLERTKTVLKLNIFSIIIKAGVSYVAVTLLKIGMTGPAWATVFVSLITVGLGIHALRESLSVTFDKEAIWKASASSIIMATMLVLIERLVFNPYLVPFYMIIGAVVYFLSLVALKAIKKSDVERVRDYLPSRLERAASWLDRLAVAG